MNNAAVGERHRLCYAQVHADGWPRGSDRHRHLLLGEHAHLPMQAVPGHRGLLDATDHRSRIAVADWPSFREVEIVIANLKLLRIGEPERDALALPLQARMPALTTEEPGESLVEIPQHLLQAMARNLTEKYELCFEGRQLVDLVDCGNPVLTPVLDRQLFDGLPKIHALRQAPIPNESNAAGGSPKQLRLRGRGIETVAIGLEHRHTMTILVCWEISMPRWPEGSTLRRGRSVVTSLHVHLVFVTKYRRGVLSERCHPVLRSAAETVCERFQAVLVEMDGEDDHVHLLVEYPPTIALSRLVNSLKGVTSRRLRQEGFPEVKAKLWGEHLWSPSYFASSCGGAPLSVIANYVRTQREQTPH